MRPNGIDAGCYAQACTLLFAKVFGAKHVHVGGCRLATITARGQIKMKPYFCSAKGSWYLWS